MLSLPDACRNYVHCDNIDKYASVKENNKFLLYFRELKNEVQRAKQEAQAANQQFGQNEQRRCTERFINNYLRDNKINPEEFKHNLSSFVSIFGGVSNNLGNYELLNINGGLKNYAASQKKIKKTVNYFDFPSTIESLLSNDDSNLTKAVAKIGELKQDSRKALENYIKLHSKDYDGLSVDDFKGDNVSNELALYRFAQHIESLFSGSEQANKDAKKKADRLKININLLNPFSLDKCVNKFEAEKLGFNSKAAKAMIGANYSEDQINRILGKDYINNLNWKNNLSKAFRFFYERLIKSTPAQ